MNFLQVQSGQRELAGHIEETKLFLFNFIDNSKKSTLRNDYYEFAAISLLFLGGALPEGRKASPSAPSTPPAPTITPAG